MSEALSRFFRELASGGLAVAIALLRVVIILAAAWGVSWVARRQIEPMMSRRTFGRNGALLVGRLLSIAAFIGAMLAILASFGANWTGLLAVLSAFTVAIGLSLQDVMKNFFAGIILLIERPFQVGDRVKVRDVEGEVQGIDVRTTLIRNTQGAMVLVPNALMFTEVLTNRSHFRTRRLDLAIEASTLPFDEVERRITASLETIDGVRKPVPPPVIVASSPEGTKYELSVLIETRDHLESRIMRTLIDQFQDSTIEVVR